MSIPNARNIMRTSPRARLSLQNLESRLAPANITVLNDADSGAGSLRQAILDLNFAASPGPDTIDFDPAFFSMPRTITLAGASGQIVIDDDLGIAGPGAANLTISGNAQTRVFHIERTTAFINVTIADLTVTGGNASSGGATPITTDGGGIRTNNVVLTLEDMVLTGNSAPAGIDGGGLSVLNAAFITVRNSTISGNTAGKNGGGIYFFNGGALLMENSTVSGNTSGGMVGGGGIYFFGTVLTAGFTIRNSTFADNAAITGSGGGLLLRSLAGAVTIQNSTFTNNSATTTSTTVGVGGGGLALWSGSATSILSLQSTIVSGNTASAANGRSDIASISAATLDAFNSAIGDTDGFTLSAASTGNLAPGAALNLQPLGDNGGPTQTIELGAGSLAIDAGINPSPSALTDQRGETFVRSVGQTDIGAFEVAAPAGIPTASGAFPLLGTPGNATYGFSIQYADDDSIDAGTLGNNDVRVTGPNGYNQLATFGSFAAGLATYTITSPGAAFVNTDNGIYTVAIEPGSVADNLGNAVPAGANGQFRIEIAGTYTITNLNDAGPGSLRQALLNANVSSTVDTVAFQTGIMGTITLTSGQLVVSQPVTIMGPGAAVLTISGGGASRIFNVENTSAIISVSISGLTVRSGNGNTGGGTPAAAAGGGIRTTNEILTLDSMVVTGNATTNGGGGVSATGGGAAITIRNSTISGNTANSGGGVYMIYRASLLIENSTISGNTAAGSVGGGGLFFDRTVGPGGVTISNTTIANNLAPLGSGGGVVLRSLIGTVLVQNSTITGNSAGVVSTTVGTGGGGIALSSGSATSILTLRSTIVSGNTSYAGNGNADLATIAAATVNAYNSAIGDADGHTLSGASTGNLPAGAVLNLGALGNNGGPTQTISLGKGSAAINAGANASPALPFDQRGAGFDRDVGGVDIGAFEVESTGGTAPTVVATQVNGGLAQRSRVTTLAVTFSTAVTFAGAVANAFTLRRNSDNAIVNFTATPSVNGLGQTVVTLDNFVPGTANITEFGSLADGNYTLTTLANQVSAGGVNMAANDTFGDVVGDNFFRYYGDITGNRRVDIADFSFFSPAYLQGTGANNPVLDFNQDGRIDIADFSQFSVRYFTTLP